MAAFDRGIGAGMAPEQVARGVANIAASRAPRLRYPVGGAARLTPALKVVLPERLYSGLARRMYGL